MIDFTVSFTDDELRAALNIRIAGGGTRRSGPCPKTANDYSVHPDVLMVLNKFREAVLAKLGVEYTNNDMLRDFDKVSAVTAGEWKVDAAAKHIQVDK
nr:hypothetical protein [uncultured Rhodopila sp.]